MALPLLAICICIVNINIALALFSSRITLLIELQIFVADNNGAEQTCLSSIRFFGSPVATTKMSDFKKVEE